MGRSDISVNNSECNCIEGDLENKFVFLLILFERLFLIFIS